MAGAGDDTNGRVARAPSTGGMLGIGALSRATAIPVETLRTWERRYGYPVPQRTASGHRVYPIASVSRLRRIGEALASGHRAREVLAASDDELRALLAATPASAASTDRWPGDEPSATLALLVAVRDFDGLAVTRRLEAEWARRGPLGFVEDCVAPLVREVGVAWADGRLDVRHEHFVSERIGDVLRTLRLPFDERATGPTVALTTLPGEPHVLGLHMAALVVSASGCRVLQLGPETPLDELQALAREQRPHAVGISVSAATAGSPTARRVRTLRSQLPARTALLVGGDGAPPAEAGIRRIRRLAELDAWARQAAGDGRPGRRAGAQSK